MISPYKPRRGGGGSSRSPRTAVPTRGLFLDSIWRCNCPERPPALKLQTKNHGVNHGRWFYTCQKDHQHRCKFFLWESDAEAREKLALLSNSRTEASASSATPQTPSSKTASAQSTGTGLLTPQTVHRGLDTHTNTPLRSRSGGEPGKAQQPQTPISAGKARMMSEDTDEFEWDDTLDSEMGKIFDSSERLRQPDFGLPPRKAPRTEALTSPGKRKWASDTAVEDGAPFVTPTPARYKDATFEVGESPLAPSVDLAGQVARVLDGHGVSIPGAAQEELKDLFNRHEMKTKGIIRGRDISRLALRKKDEEIARLNERIAGLEAQRELDRSVMGALKGSDGK